MTQLPAGWRWSTVAQVGAVDLGRQRHPDWHHGPEMHPYLRVANVFEDRIDTTDLKEMDFSGVFERYKLAPGDVLLNEGQSPELLGRPAIYRGTPEGIAFTNSLIRFRAGPDITPEWALVVFRHYMNSGRFAREARITTNIAHLSASRFKSIEFPVPPLTEQQRIVDILEGHLSRLDAAASYLAAAHVRAEALYEQVLEARLRNLRAVQRPLGEVLAAPLTNGRSVPTREGGFPVLRLTALKDGIIDLSERKSGDWSLREASRFLVAEGDFLIARGNGSRRLVGRGGLVESKPDAVAFPDTLIRARPDQKVIVPEFLAHVWNSRTVRRQIEARARTTAGIYKINQKQLAQVSFPVPDLSDQEALSIAVSISRVTVQALADDIARAARRGEMLRGSLLAAATSGRLTGRRSDLDGVEQVAGV